MRVEKARTAGWRLWLRGGIVLALSATAILVSPAIGSANNDPHRSFSPPTSGTLTGLCSFNIDYSTLVDNEYSTISNEPDGSALIKTTGSLVQRLTNDITQNSIVVNIPGPGTVTIPASGTVITIDGHGLNAFGYPNLTDFGLPSNAMLTSGPLQYTVDVSTFPGKVVSITRTPHVLLDICAALS